MIKKTIITKIMALCAFLISMYSYSYTYTVQSGDTLWAIGQKFGVSADSINKVNPGLSSNLALGNKVIIPIASWTIRSGDTIDSIAQSFGLSDDDVLSANPGVSPATLYLGQQIIIPGISLYVVQSGDSFSSIVTAFNVSPDTLAAANPGIPASSLLPGDLLNIPGSSTYRIKTGDSLSAIAQSKGVTVDQLKAVNPGVSDTSLQIGQTLNIPHVSSSTSNTTASINGCFYTTPDGNGAISFSVSDAVSISQKNPIYLTLALNQKGTGYGTMKTGSGQAWAYSPYGDTVPDNLTFPTLTVEQVGSGAQYMVYPTSGSFTLNSGSVYSLTFSETGFLLASIDITNPPTAPVPAPRPAVINKPTFTGTLGLRVGYVQISGEHTAEFIDPTLAGSCNVIVFAFAPMDARYDADGNLVGNFDVPTDVSDHIIDQIIYVMNYSSSNTTFLYSVGGANQFPSGFKGNEDKIVSNVLSQINYINKKTEDYGQITGVDLDLEGGMDASTIQCLTSNFKSCKINGNLALVSWAPQPVGTGNKQDSSGNIKVSSSDPSNFGMSSGGFNDQYGEALKEVAPDYIFIQCYNTLGFTVDGYSEADPKFFTAMVNLLNAKFANTKIQIAIGLPANRGAGAYSGTIFQPSRADNHTWLTEKYDQQGGLDQIKAQLGIITNSNKPVKGVMTWSLNNDSRPQFYQDYWAKPGAFCQTIFGASTSMSSVPAVPYMTISVKYAAVAKGNHGKTGCVALTFVIDGKYYVFAAQNPSMQGANLPLELGKLSQWGSITSIVQGMPGPGTQVEESGDLDELASSAGTADGIDATVQVSWYNDNSAIDKTVLSGRLKSKIKLYPGYDHFFDIAINETDISTLNPRTLYNGINFIPGGYVAYAYSPQNANTVSATTQYTYLWSVNDYDKRDPSVFLKVLKIAIDIGMMMVSDDPIGFKDMMDLTNDVIDAGKTIQAGQSSQSDQSYQPAAD